MADKLKAIETLLNYCLKDKKRWAVLIRLLNQMKLEELDKRKG